MENLFKDMIAAALEAGKEVLRIYEKDFEIFYKEDGTPLTLADKISNEIIKGFLKKYNLFILSEEEKEKDYKFRKNLQRLFIVDPLDGTKEFIKKNDEFTINIAYVENNFPVFGVVYAPALGKLYFGGASFGSFSVKINTTKDVYDEKINVDNILKTAKKIESSFPKNKKLFVCVSRSHLNEKTINFLNILREKEFEISYKKIGSSLKFCLIAEGEAHFYPRLSPTMEWDTAAAQAIVEGANGSVVDLKGNKLFYNKEKLKNPNFLVFCKDLKKLILEDKNSDSRSS